MFFFNGERAVEHFLFKKKDVRSAFFLFYDVYARSSGWKKNP